MVGSDVSLSQVQPCFQLLRMGSDHEPPSSLSTQSASSQDLYTFLPDSSRCVYRLGARADLCDVLLPGKPLVHAEIHAEREAAGDWRVSVGSCTNYGVYINDVHLPPGQRLELSDGDLLGFQEKPPSPSSSMDVLFLFQRVRVRPLDFCAITSPRARAAFPGFTPVLGTQRIGGERGGTPHYMTGATVILNSIGSISKLKRERMHSGGLAGGVVEVTKPTTPDLPLPSRTGLERRSSRRKAQHRVLCELEEDDVEERHGDQGATGKRKRKRGRPKEEERSVQQVETGRKPRGRPRKNPVPPLVVSQTISSAEPCAWRSCRLPQEDTVSWVQCDRCDSWYHVVCIGRSLTSLQDTDFHCGCT
ncbi:transcription factor 19 [Spea bombifrons]|uniref:transcription factor 19 n=1 Tax=Spea bombifrons TaxID=233779 RepID=UPI002349AF94|nr:transcription factor 19 [Spea bombifrons]